MLLGYAAGTIYQPPASGFWGRAKQYFHAYRTIYWDEAWWTAKIPKAEQVMDTMSVWADKIAIPAPVAAVGVPGSVLASLSAVPGVPAPLLALLNVAR